MMRRKTSETEDQIKSDDLAYYRPDTFSAIEDQLAVFPQALHVRTTTYM